MAATKPLPHFRPLVRWAAAERPAAGPNDLDQDDIRARIASQRDGASSSTRSRFDAVKYFYRRAKVDPDGSFPRRNELNGPSMPGRGYFAALAVRSVCARQARHFTPDGRRSLTADCLPPERMYLSTSLSPLPIHGAVRAVAAAFAPEGLDDGHVVWNVRPGPR